MKFVPGSSARVEENRIQVGSLIEYEQHGKSALGFVIGERKGVYQVVNEQEQELSLSPDRIFLLPKKIEIADRKAARAALALVRGDAEERRKNVDLSAVWELLASEKREVSERSVAEIVFTNVGAEELLAVRRALAEDKIYFKRRKTGFEPRPEETVEELKKKAIVEAEKAEERASFRSEVLRRLKGAQEPFPRNWNRFGISDLEQLAALGSSSPSAKETTEFLEELIEEAKLKIDGKPQDKAFSLLVQLGHFNSDSDLNLVASGRPVHFPPHVEKELSALVQAASEQAHGVQELFTVTIDSESTRDIDDALSLVELPDGFRIGIHISDVAAVVPLESKLDEHATRRGTSIYAPDYQVPMFPPELSEMLLSLVASTVRPVMSFYIETDRLFEVRNIVLRREFLQISKRLSYNEVDALLTESDPREGDELSRMLFHLWDAASAFESKRICDGALQLPRRELIPRVDAQRQVSLETIEEETPARKLVAEMMVAANTAAALYAQKHNLPIAFRSQEKPDIDILASGMDIPEGPAREYYRRGQLKRSLTSVDPAPHSGLGVMAYTQVTSPIRRAFDLLTQRQLASHLSSGKPLFNRDEFKSAIEGLEATLDEASYLQRQRNRYWLLRYLEQRKEKFLYGVIVRVENQRPLVELEQTMTLFPFQPVKAVGEFADKERSRLGERVRLRVQKLNAREDKILLIEDPE